MEVKQIGSTLEVKYKEPTTNADGSVLSDLGKVTLEAANTADLGTPIAQLEVVASAPTGGADQTATLDVPIVGGTVQDLTITGIALDLVGNKSEPKSVQLVIDTLAPAPIE